MFSYQIKEFSDQISIGSCNGDFDLDEIIKNSVNQLINF